MFYCQIFKGSSSRDKIEDSYYSFLKTPIGVENVLSTSETAKFSKVEVPETRLKTLFDNCVFSKADLRAIDTASQKQKLQKSNSALFDSCPFWLVLFLVCAIFGSCCFEDSYYSFLKTRASNI